MTEHVARRLVLAAVLAVVAPTIVATQAPASAEVGVLPTTYGTGIAGGLAGQVGAAHDSVVDPAGNVYVSDRTGNRIAVFAGDGTFLRAFGWDVVPGGQTGLESCTTTCQAGAAGAGAGQLSSPDGIALSGTELYVADQNNNRISVFSTSGTFVRAFGGNVNPGGAIGFEICTVTCQAGTGGGLAGELFFPFDVATDGAGNVYVADNLDSRISVYGANGSSFQRAFGADVVPGGGTGPEVCTTVTTCKAGLASGIAGGLNYPAGLTLDGAGDLVVADQNNQRVDVFTTAGAFVRTFGVDVLVGGSTGYEVCTSGCKVGVGSDVAGGLQDPADVSVDALGHVWVADFNSNRVAEYGLAGGFIKAFGYDVIPGNVATTFEVCTATCKAGVYGNGPGQLGQPSGVTVGCNGQLLVAEDAGARVERFGEPNTLIPPCTVAAPPPPPGAGGGDSPACAKAKKQLKAAKAKLKKLKKKHAGATAISKAKAKVKKAKKKVKKAC